ncbi:MAG: nucleotidyltransferase family protein [Candidatus Yonathbacteria bacterium]|nr:nucleotidyltransferase family protein [Candidatus Yonathbacteria bacterium]
MKAVIFAAGEGRRLHPLTLEMPKPLVEVLGKPLIQYTWEALPDVIDEVIVVVGYRKEMVRDFLGDEFMGKKVTYVEQFEPLGTAHALKLCKSHLGNEEKFLLMYADDIHGKEGVAKCVEYDRALLVSFVDDPRSFGVVVPNEDGTIKNIEEKPEHPKSNLAVTGVYVLSPEIFEHEVSHTRKGEYYLTDMIERYIHRNPMQIVESDLWLPVGYPHDITRAEEILSGMTN